MRSVNTVTLIGNITRDPEVRKTSSGQTIATFGIATNREWVGNDGQKQSLAEYHNIVAWGRLAELCQELLSKGKLVYISGYLKTRSWDHETGVKIFRTEIVANDMIMLEKRDSNDDISNNDEKIDVSEENSVKNSFDDIDDDFFADMSTDEESETKK